MANRNKINGSNGVSYGTIITVSAQDVIDGSVSGSFGSTKPLAFSINVVDASDVNVPLADAELTFNDSENGDFSIADGAVTFALVADQKIHIVAQYARLV